MKKGNYERTLVILKPDALQRRLIGKITSSFEEKGMTIVGIKMLQLEEQCAEKHYAAHKGKHFYKPLIRFITSAPIVVLVLEGKSAIAITREMVGPTNSSDANPSTIRGRWGLSNRFNLIHASDSPESADSEIRMYFENDEICDYKMCDEGWVYDLSEGEPV